MGHFPKTPLFSAKLFSTLTQCVSNQIFVVLYYKHFYTQICIRQIHSFLSRILRNYILISGRRVLYLNSLHIVFIVNVTPEKIYRYIDMLCRQNRNRPQEIRGAHKIYKHDGILYERRYTYYTFCGG